MAKSGSTGGTPATVALTRAKAAFTLYAYDHDPAEVHFGEEAAAKLGVAPDRLFKTLVLDTGSGLAVAVVPVSARLDLKAAAAALGVKKVSLADPAVAARSSGYVIGGISPIGQKTKLPTLVDGAAAGHELIMVSAGRRGLQVEVSPADLITVTSGRYGTIT